MKTLIFLLAFSASAFGQSAASINFSGGETPGNTMTVNPNGFTPEINGLEITQIVNGCSGVVLQAGITSASTSAPLTVPAGCTVLPGMGIAIGCAPGGGSCPSVSIVKAAGCTGSAPVSCPVVQGQFGSTPGTYAAGSAVTVLKYGNGSAAVCGIALTVFQTLAQLGAATAGSPPQPALASTAVATQNTAIAAAAATNTSTIAAAFSCAPNL